MSDPESNNPQPLARWVKAKVVGEEAEPAADKPQPDAEGSPPRVPQISESELAGARWFAIAFLVVIVPLGLVVLGLLVWGAIRSIPSPP